MLLCFIVQLVYGLQAQFIYLDNGEFKLNSQSYYPMVLNFVTQLRKNSQNDYWVTSSHSYGNTNEFECHNRVDCLNEIKAQFQMIKDMGFNTVRLCGITPDYNSDYPSNNSGKIFMTTLQLDEGTPVFYSQNVQEEITANVRVKIFSFISDILNIAEDRGLKVILLCGGPDSEMYRDNYADYLEFLAYNFKNNTTLLGYDLFNEPTYFSKMKQEGLSKSQICYIVSGWINRMKAVDPNHLFTIGFAGPKTVADWDPELISIDFASFHSYGSSNQVGNDIYWYSNNMSKPWIIGETGFPADNIQSTYTEQKQFVSNITKRCVDCGGVGFSWWQYQDVWWGSFYEDYLGLVNHNGITNTSISGLSIQGTLKPSVDEIVNFSSYIPTNNCPMYSNYFNQSQPYKSKVSGYILNSHTQSAIEGAVIHGRDINWNIISTTYSRSNGYFELLTDSTVPIRIINYDYLKMKNGVFTLPEISNSNPSYLYNIIFNISQSNTFNSQNSITTGNFTVKGNGISGGDVVLNAPLYVKFTSGTKVEKGGKLNVSSNYVLGTLSLEPIYSCSLFSKDFDTTINQENLLLTEVESGLTSVYPNPTNDILNINTNNSLHKSIDIYNIFGKLEFSKSTSEIIETIDISALSSGVYLLKISSFDKNELLKIIRR